MKSTLLLILEFLLILAGIIVNALGILSFPILPLFLVAWASLHLRHMRWRDVGLHRPERWLPTIGLALLVGVGYQAMDIYLIAPLLQRLTGEAVDISMFSGLRGNLFVLVAFIVISWTEAAFVEEMYFRGYFLNRLMDIAGRERLGIVLAVIGNALVFGMAHSYQGITGVLDTVIAGLVLGLLYFLARRNLWLPILTHGIIDTVGFLLIFFGMYSG